MRMGDMSHKPFTSRSSGVLFWAGSYLVAGIAWGIGLAALWPQGGVCSTSCGARIEAGAIAMVLLAAGGLAGFAVAVWLGVSRRTIAPRRLVAVLVGILVASLITAVLLAHSASAGDEASGLANVRAVWSWALAVPTSALLATALIALVRNRLTGRHARPAGSARPRGA
jgi:hypothetical protein